ncbi:MAG: DMT family transporter [Sphingomonadales bacterium]|nr:DMT family transporter [Sphingomonadales bacterium]
MPPVSKTILLTIVTLVAFAANSVLTRLALEGGTIDAASFTLIRVSAGAFMLAPLAWLAGGGSAVMRAGSWGSAVALFAYAIAFSFAYLTLDAGTGALILFAAVQASMIGIGMVRGEWPRAAEWLGLLTALGGLAYLVSPGLTAPKPEGAALMAVAGIAWGVYSIRGRGSAAPLAETAGNFIRALPFALVSAGLAIGGLNADLRGVLLAVASGALASGLGYAIWYTALRGLSATTAAIVQLAVPVIAALGGVFFIGEAITLRLAIAAIIILGGIAVAILGRRRSESAA